MFRCVRGHGGRRARLATVSPARWMSFLYRPMHVFPVWCWPACVRSVCGPLVLVCGRVSRLLVGSFGVGSLSLQRALAQSDLLRAGVLLVAVLAGASCVGPARYVFTVRRLPTAGEKSNDKWSDRCKKKFSPFGALVPALPWQCCMHNPSSGISRCSVAVLPVSLVPFICTPPAGGKAPSVPLGASLCSPLEPQGAVPARWCGARARVCLPAVSHIVPFFCGSCGRLACVAVLSLVIRMARAVRLVLWCRNVPSDVVGWARRNTSVPAGRGSAWPRVASLLAPACPGWGFGG